MSGGEPRSHFLRVLAVLTAACLATPALAAERTFAIPPQPLASALKAFGDQSGGSLLYPSDVSLTGRSAGAVGKMEPEVALSQLLAGSGLEFRRIDRGFIIRPMERAHVAPPQASKPSIRTVEAAVSPPEPPPPINEIVVTGTLVRGAAPSGGHVVRVAREEILRAGVAQPNQLLATIPQMAGFNAVARTQTAIQGVTAYRPNLHNLPPLQNGTTLILLDGHNLVGSALQQNYTDIGLLPTAAIERVEVVLDGQSASYGSDAVGGVMNFITRSRFEGVELSANAGVASRRYETSGVDFLGGKTWPEGALVLALSTRSNTALLGRDRDLPRQDLTSVGFSDYRVRTCDPGNIILGATTYALPSREPGALNLCDNALLTAIAPRERQNGAFLSISHAPSADMDFQLKAFGAQRATRTPAPQLVDAGALIDASNPYFAPVNGETQHTVAFSWAPVLGETTSTELRLREFDISPSLTWRIGGDWEVRGMVDYGRSYVVQKVPQLNTAAEGLALRGGSLTTETALNPYDIASTNAAVLNSVTDFWNYASSRQTSATARAVADGPLVELPGGDLRIAAGFQVQRVSISSLTATGRVNDFSNAVKAARSRRVDAVFAEVFAPLVGPSTARPLMQALDLSLSARFNDYQDIGSTLNPKFGVTWGVTRGLNLRASWGTAFVAPGLNDNRSDGTDATVLIASTTTNLRPGDPLTDRNRPNLAITGGTTGVRPVEARTWSVGADIRPSRLEDLDLSLSFWSVEMDNLIQAGCVNSVADQLADPSLDGVCYFYRPSLETVTALTSPYRIVLGSQTSAAALYGVGNDPYYLQDRRKRNYGGFNSTGLDFRMSYRRPTRWGAFYTDVRGVKYITREQQQVAGGPFADLLAANNPRLALQAIAGVDIGGFTGALTVFHTGGFPVTSIANQTDVGAFTPLNLFLRYAFSEKLSFTLNIDNLADIDPPTINQSGGLSGSTLGRYITAAVRKQF